MILILRKESFFITAWKVPKYEVFSGLYFPVFSPNTGKYGPEKYPYLDTFHAVYISNLVMALGVLATVLLTKITKG